jgi:antitoxin component YwqK of YwqJK toxin-antitoxin module
MMIGISKLFRIFAIITFLCATSENIVAQNVTMNGVFKLYYPNSKNIFVKGNYKDSLPTGKWQFYNQDGSLMEVHNYSDGLLNDSFFVYYHRKYIKRGFYANNKKQGKWTYYNYDKGSISGTRFYRNDSITGTETTESYTMEHKNGKANGKFVRYSQGKIEIRGQYIKNSREGVWYSRRSGIKLYTFKNNKLNDTMFQYYNDSTLNLKAVYKDNKLNGPSFHYRVIEDKMHKKQSVCWKLETYKDNKLDGLYAEFFNTGDTFKVDYFREGKSIGPKRTYSVSGQRIEIPEQKENSRVPDSDEITFEIDLPIAEAEDAEQRLDNELWNRFTYPYTGFNDRKCPTTNYINARRRKYPPIENIDSLKISGTVILEFFVFQNGRPSAAKFLKHLSPIADNIALYLALNQSCQPTSLNGMEIASKYYLTVEF